MVAHAVNTIPKTVFSSTLEEAPWGRWDAAQVVKASAYDSGIVALRYLVARSGGRDGG